MCNTLQNFKDFESLMSYIFMSDIKASLPGLQCNRHQFEKTGQVLEKKCMNFACKQFYKLIR